MRDYVRYKNLLRDYLKIKGVEVKHGVCHCFNPAHKDKNPSCVVSINYYYCPACNMHGDIYDAVKLLEKIHDPKKAFDFLKNLLR
jgi:DNA primase